ncbi:hypothetical protein Athai_41600 [Actinocatenispora thailandica]|uniref:DUF4097 domain-containing protein n=1 Tax=Actinocatenispora thailandica TaxID=227318 RepID=A0A7R7DRV7_9ACTN|nr:DUF4097 family beta strand repeat-containing protein [Actinocatenispora thailandica]BCJ36657.1 hypothetical protein Athai_41600 [Actinocatenispora thailandica]
MAFVVLLLAIGLAVTFGLRQAMHPAHRADHSNTYHEVTRLSVDTDSADVRVRRGTGSAVTVASHLEWSSDTPKVTAAMHAGTLSVGTSPCRGTQFGIQICRIRITLTVPAALPATLRTDSGDLNISDLSGSVDAKADSGNVKVVGLSGPLTVRADSGDIEADELSSKTVRFNANSGDATLRFVTAPSRVVGAADSGNVTIELPNTSGGYDLALHADSGGVHAPAEGVHRESSRKIRADADSGDVTVRVGNP